MTAPTTRAELSDEDYRAIARAAWRFGTRDDEVVDLSVPGIAVVYWGPNAHEVALVMNGRAAVTEYLRRAKR